MMSNSIKTDKMQSMVSEAIEQVKKYDARGDVVLRRQAIDQMYDIPGAPVAYVDAALCNAGFAFAVPASRRK